MTPYVLKRRVIAQHLALLFFLVGFLDEYQVVVFCNLWGDSIILDILLQLTIDNDLVTFLNLIVNGKVAAFKILAAEHGELVGSAFINDGVVDVLIPRDAFV